MPFIKITLSKFRLEKDSFTKKLDEVIKSRMRQAAREFFRSASESVPVLTGFARGSLGNILEAVGGVSPTISGTTRRKTPAQSFFAATRLLAKQRFVGKKIGKIRAEKVVLPRIYYYFGRRKVVKTPEAGKAFATKPENIFQVKNYVYSFNYKVSISYFDINDQYINVKTPGTPWKAFERGLELFMQYMAGMKLPKVMDYIVTERVGSNG